MSELTTLFQNTADAIRSKTGDTATMQASQFPAKIQSISVGISQDEADARYLQLSGGTMTGALTLAGDPTADLQAATKQYVDARSSSPKLLATVTTNLTIKTHTTLNATVSELWGFHSILLEFTPKAATNELSMGYGIIRNAPVGVTCKVICPLRQYEDSIKCRLAIGFASSFELVRLLWFENQPYITEIATTSGELKIYGV